MRKSSEERKQNENEKRSLSESQKQWASLFSQIKQYRPNENFQQRYLNKYPVNINGMSEAFIANAIMMNDRLKNLNTYPSKYDKAKVEEMVANPQNYEMDLRALSRYVYNTLTPIYKQVHLYADILTYRTYVNISNIKSKSKLIKEYNRISNFLRNFDVERTFRKVTLSTVLYGKSFWYLRTDRGEDNICLQQLPADYVKITGITNRGFQIAFNMAYFLNPENSVLFFPPEFKEYLNKFYGFYNRNTNIFDLEKFKQADIDDVIAFQESSALYFWQFLDIDKSFVFSIDETTFDTSPALMSSFGSAMELDKYRALEQEILTLPLQALLTSEIEISDKNISGAYSDDTAITPDMVALFTELLQQKMPQTVSAIAAPFKNFKLHEFEHVDTKDSVLGDALKNYYIQSGVNSLISTSEKPTLSQTRAAEKIEARYIDKLYCQYQTCLNSIIKTFKLKNDFVVHVEGDVFSDDSEYAKVKEAVQNGQTDLVPKQQSFFSSHIDEAIATSEFMEKCNYYGNLQQMGLAIQKKQSTGNPVGRPSANVDEVTSENTAISIEQGTNTVEGREVTRTSETTTNTEETFSKLFSQMSEDEIEDIKDFLNENY